MLLEIVEYLYSFKDDNWHSLNEFLKSNYGDSEATIREALVKLVLANRIKVKENRHIHLNNWKRINEWDYQNSFTNLDNWILEGKITLEERERIDIENRKTQPSTIYQPIFNGPANAIFGDGKFQDIQQTINDTKKPEKNKWLTWNFYWEEIVKLGWKWIVITMFGFVAAYLGFKNFGLDDSSQLKSQPQKELESKQFIPIKKNSPKINSFNSDLRDQRTILVTNGSIYGPCNAGKVDGCWRNLTEGDVGDTIGVQLFYHNTSNYLAVDVSVGMAPLDNKSKTIHIIRGGVFVSGYEAIIDSATVILATPSILEYIPNSALWFPNQSSIGKAIPNDPALISNYGLKIGDLPPGWQTQGTITFKMIVKNIDLK